MKPRKLGGPGPLGLLRHKQNGLFHTLMLRNATVSLISSIFYSVNPIRLDCSKGFMGPLIIQFLLSFVCSSVSYHIYIYIYIYIYVCVCVCVCVCLCVSIFFRKSFIFLVLVILNRRQKDDRF